MAALSGTYLEDYSRVHLAGTALGTAAVRFERSSEGGSWVAVRGAVSQVPAAGAASADDCEFTPRALTSYRAVVVATGAVLATTMVVPQQMRAWLKFPLAPGCNLPVTLTGWSSVSRSSRSVLHAVTGRRDPVVESELAGPRGVTVSLRTADVAATAALDTRLSLGQPVYLSMPPEACALGCWHAVVQSATVDRPRPRSQAGTWSVELVETGPPDPLIPGRLATWASVRVRYRDWAEVKATYATWGELKAATIAGPDDLLVASW